MMAMNGLNQGLRCIVLAGLATAATAARVQDPQPPAEPPRIVRPFPGVTVRADEKTVEIEAEVCLSEGFLEQIACGPNSREHESLVVIRTMPSEIHAALLLAGFESGRPGRWIYEGDDVRTEPPSGDAVEVLVRYEKAADGQGAVAEIIEKPISAWIRDHNGKGEFPGTPWIFGGSHFKPKPEWMDDGKGEYYTADFTGSIIGLVTFGDEVLGFGEVISDKEELAAPVWEVKTDAIPAEGTKVTIVIRPVKKNASGS
jgi:hypothetical protein